VGHDPALIGPSPIAMGEGEDGFPRQISAAPRGGHCGCRCHGRCRRRDSPPSP
jgi:hypothetical protein